MTERKKLTIKITDDCFKTCRCIPVCEIGGYSDIALLKDKLFIFYEKTLFTGSKEKPLEPFELFLDKYDISCENPNP